MELDQYLKDTFPGLELRPPLFYSWDIGIRFELGTNYFEKGLHRYVSDIYERAIKIFKSQHAPEDDIYIVTTLDFLKNDVHKINNRKRTFVRYIKNPKIGYNVKHQILSYEFPEDDEDNEFCTPRFSLKCKVKDLNYIGLIKALCNVDTGVKPILNGRTYIINIKRSTVFHIYDDRGCDLISSSKDEIRSTYSTCYSWILDYDKAKIDKIFLD